MPSMTKERRFFDMTYLKEKVYAVGGYDSSVKSSVGLSSMESMGIFDSTTRTWTKKSIPFSVGFHCISQLSANQFILIAGYNFDDGVSKNVMKKIF